MLSINYNFGWTGGVPGGGVPVTNANNGLSVTGATVQLGGTLIKNTDIATTGAFVFSVTGALKYVDGNQAANKVLSSDAAGNASWQTISFDGAVTGTGTNNVGVKWTNGAGGVVGDGTWAYNTNDWYPLTDGSNLGKATTNRIGTIYMASTIDYASNLSFVSSSTTMMYLTTAGLLGIGTGTTTPITNLEIAANSGLAFVASTRYESAVSAPAGFAGRKARGTQASPSAVAINDEISAHAGLGYHSGGAFQATATGAAIFVAAQAFTSTAQGTYWKVGTTALGTTTKLDRLWVSSEGDVGINISAPTARLHVVGVDATSSNYCFKSQDSAFNPLLYIRNDGLVTIIDMTVGRGGGLISTNTVLGTRALDANITGDYNVAVGWRALFSNTTARGNTAIGEETLYFNTTGQGNVAAGSGALNANTTGSFLVAAGQGALESNTTGNFSVGIGKLALANSTTPDSNVGIGYRALNNNIIGSQNTAIGGDATLFLNNGSFNTAIGSSAGTANDGSNNIFIGYLAGGYRTTDSNRLFIDNINRTNAASDLTNALITGIFDATVSNQYVRFNASVGIGIDALARLHVIGLTNSINQRLEPVAGVRQDTGGATVNTTDATQTTLSTIAIPSNTIQAIVVTINYRKTGGAGVGTTGQGTTITLSSSVQNISGTLTLDIVQNTYSGITNAIAGVSATLTVSGTNILVRVTGVASDNITWNVVSIVNT